MLVNSFIYSNRSKHKQTLSGEGNMHAIHANFSYSTKIISFELFKCLCFRMFLKRQYCVRISVCVSLHPDLFIWRWWEVVSSVCGGLQRDSVFSVRMVEKIIFVYFEGVKKHQKKTWAWVLLLNSLTNGLFVQWRRPCWLLETPWNVSIM